jgi:hypothetical protein|tara:strand:- start:1472 stop:1630 length:159 start_codon:yes stop_codon:yes gene_type:complete
MIKLNQRQKNTLQKHKKHHTKKHMDFMIKQMTKNKPLTFTEAHKLAIKKVGV